MKRYRGFALLLFCFSLSMHAQRSNLGPIANEPAARWWSHVSYLAADSMLGRETGSESGHKAAEYIAEAFRRAGLQPCGTRGYFQPIRMIGRRIVEDKSSLSLERNGVSEPLVQGEEVVFNMRVAQAPSLTAPVIFAGYGLTVPEIGYDDLAGLDVKGKVVLLLTGGPRSIAAPLLSHYQTQRWKFLRRAGALGELQIQNPHKMDIPWERSKLRRLMPQMVLEDQSLNETADEQLAILVNPAHADKLFTGSGHSFKEILTIADTGRPLPRFALPVTLGSSVTTETWTVYAENVVGLLHGTDPKLKDEYVVLSSHFDHLGVGEPVHGDNIYNGAMDNAAGVATLMETSASIREAKTHLRRSVVFLAVTAEEKGLLGSKYFAAHPTVPEVQIIADVNVDMFLPLFPLKKLMVQGSDESDLGADARSAAGAMNIEVVPDPEPQRDSFTRSDQYSFVKRGIPSIALKEGFLKDTPEQEIVRLWRSERYHGPADDLNQPIDFQAAADFNRVYLSLVETIANRPARPRWNANSFFRRFAP